jgi:hypothetical protein
VSAATSKSTPTRFPSSAPRSSPPNRPGSTRCRVRPTPATVT